MTRDDYLTIHGCGLESQHELNLAKLMARDGLLALREGKNLPHRLDRYQNATLQVAAVAEAWALSIFNGTLSEIEIQ